MCWNQKAPNMYLIASQSFPMCSEITKPANSKLKYIKNHEIAKKYIIMNEPTHAKSMLKCILFHMTSSRCDLCSANDLCDVITQYLERNISN